MNSALKLFLLCLLFQFSLFAVGVSVAVGKLVGVIVAVPVGMGESVGVAVGG